MTTGLRFTLRPAGRYTVMVTNQATRTSVAEVSYTVTPQTPREALDAWGGARGGFEAMGAALAAWRLGDRAKALEVAQTPLSSERFFPDAYNAHKLIYAIAMRDREYARAIDAAQTLIQARQQANPGSRSTT